MINDDNNIKDESSEQLNNETPVEEIQEGENTEVVQEEQIGIIKEVDLNKEMKTSLKGGVFFFFKIKVKFGSVKIL